MAPGEWPEIVRFPAERLARRHGHEGRFRVALTLHPRASEGRLTADFVEEVDAARIFARVGGDRWLRLKP
jgi:hypothetical protein